jgi:hypothetical protein
MCSPLDTIKLCTCDLGENKPPNYWILYRFKNTDQLDIVGEAVMPYPIKGYEINESVLLETLNQLDCFDKPMTLNSKDRIEINLELKGKFVFEFDNEKWTVADKSDPFWVENSFAEVETGVVETKFIQQEEFL